MSLLLPSEIAKLAAEAGGKTHAEAMKILKKENPDWPEGDLADAANSVSPSMGADARRVQKRYQALTKKASIAFKAGDAVRAGLGAVGHLSMDGPAKPGRKLPQDVVGVVQSGGPRAGFVPVKFDQEPELWVSTGSLLPLKTASSESPMILPSELARIGKFPAGVSMTIDEVAAVVGDSFKEMNENPPPEVVKVREEMMDKAASSDSRAALSLLNQALIALSDLDFPQGSTGHREFIEIANDLVGAQVRLRSLLRADGKLARFEEGPAGAKAFDAWMAKQPKEVQDDWKKYTEENGDKFKTASSHECPVCGGEDSDEDKAGWGLPRMCQTCYSHLSDLENDGKDVKKILTKDKVLPFKTARYEEGVPADPTKEMSPEDAKKWEGNTDKYKDKFTNEESMMDKYQEQLLPSESFSLMAGSEARRRSTWKTAEVEDDIGKKVKGPEESDKDEKFMKGQFTQVENSELSGKVAAEAYAEGSRVKQNGGKEGTVTKAKMVEGKQMYEVKWDGASISVDRKHADLKPVKTSGQKIYGHLEWLE